MPPNINKNFLKAPDRAALYVRPRFYFRKAHHLPLLPIILVLSPLTQRSNVFLGARLASYFYLRRVVEHNRTNQFA